jgi:protocatechuate 3,4-dioxygenase beta subunit
MGNRWFSSRELARLQRRQRALRPLSSRRDALGWLATTPLPLLGCVEREGAALEPDTAHEPYQFPSAGAESDAAGAPGSSRDVCRAPGNGCAETADNILGPFYKPDAPFRSDLTIGASVGKLLEVSGRVVGCDCETPLIGAVVDIWQADESGAYDNTGYVLRGRVRSDADGMYRYTSVLPGAYLNGSQYRPKHIHYMVSHPSAAGLVTQLYFEGDPYIAQDPYVKDALVMPLFEDSGISRVTFDLVLV